METTIYMILDPNNKLWLQEDTSWGRFGTAFRFESEFNAEGVVTTLGYGIVLPFRSSDFIKEITPAYQWDEIYRLKGDIFALETAYSKSEDMNEFLLNEIKELERENEDLKAIRTNLKREITVLEERLDLIYETGVDNDEKLMAEIGVLRQTIDELGEDNDELMAENARLDALVDENIELRARVSELAEGRIAYELANGRIAELEDQVEKYKLLHAAMGGREVPSGGGPAWVEFSGQEERRIWEQDRKAIQTLSDENESLRAELDQQRRSYNKLWDEMIELEQEMKDRGLR